MSRAYVVGSYARGEARLEAGPGGPPSDFDVLLEVPRQRESAEQLAEWYRRRIQQHFVTHNIRGQSDGQHPQWEGRRVDVYFTYDADAETRPKIELVNRRSTKGRY